MVCSRFVLAVNVYLQYSHSANLVWKRNESFSVRHHLPILSGAANIVILALFFLSIISVWLFCSFRYGISGIVAGPIPLCIVSLVVECLFPPVS